ncbi:MAG: hypothetical protein KAS53_05085 [Candidatus Cloacimonetes bacterium]|nr:hypothetical protein [Candidatus Cloacimonadota bacterium]
MKYEDIGKEMLLDIQSDSELIDKYKLSKFDKLDFNINNKLIHTLFAICKNKDEKAHKDEEKTNTARICKQIDHILNF